MIECVETQIKNSLTIIQESNIEQQKKEELVDSIICLHEELVIDEPKFFLIKALLSFLSEVIEIKKEMVYIKMYLDIALDLGY